METKLNLFPMFWIDKHNRGKRGQGHAIVNKFLSEAWNEEEEKYVNCTYENFRRDHKMETLLYKEQHGFCCYCMRHLQIGAHTTLEHVMPHNCKNNKGKVDCEKVRYYKFFNNNFNNVTYIHLKNSKRKWRVGPPYPHFCAYENLVLSCDGSLFTDENDAKGTTPSMRPLCCNEHRGDNKIIPLFFLQDITQTIVYNEDGTIGVSDRIKSWKYKEEILKTIDSLALEHERLRIIRETWRFIALSHKYSVDQVKRAIDDEGLRDIILADSGVPMRLVKRINQRFYWALFAEYFWFYGYFLHQS